MANTARLPIRPDIGALEAREYLFRTCEALRIDPDLEGLAATVEAAQWEPR
jgi:hypothetical protein